MRKSLDFNFARVPAPRIERSTFNLSHGHKTTFDMGYLIPIMVQEVLPGDTISCQATLFARLLTPVAPIMDNLYLTIHYWFCPNRLLWENWQRFCGEQDNPGDSTSYLIPTLSPTGGGTGFYTASLADYFGLPLQIAATTVNALPFRMYNRVWKEWYRDQNLQNSPVIAVNDGPDLEAWYPKRRRGKRHDYFTSALPWPQKGAAATLPMGTSADVWGDGTTLGLYDDQSNFFGLAQSAGANNEAYFDRSTIDDPVGTSSPTPGGAASNRSIGVVTSTSGHQSGLYADLTTALAVTVNQLRQTIAVQKMLERDARGGTRYIELLFSHFGVTSPDARLQRPEYLGGQTRMFHVNPVAQTSSTDATSPQGNLAAYALCVHNGGGSWTKSFVEHGYIMALVSASADITYQQGINRMWLRETRYDFYWPAFAHLGEQVVTNQEIYHTGIPATDEAAFGYQERYAEYRYHPSIVSGLFRHNPTAPFTTLDYWHCALWFGALPTLNDTFIQDNPPIDRCIAVTDEHHIMMDSMISLRATRPMPVYSIPGFMDHF